MKTWILILCLAVMSTASMTGTARAEDVFPPDTVNGSPFMTLSGSVTAKDAFEWHEEPFVYSWFSNVDPLLEFQVTRTWMYGLTEVAKEQETFSGLASIENWRGLSNWADVRQAGDWFVTTEFGYTGSSFTGFAGSMMTVNPAVTVTPEPLSAALFLIGGLAMAAGRTLKRKQAGADR